MANYLQTVLDNIIRTWHDMGDGSHAPAVHDAALLAAVGGGTITQTKVVLTAGQSAPLIGANTSRKFLAWMNVGTAPVTVAPGAGAVVAGEGLNFDPGVGTGRQGGGWGFDMRCPTNAFAAISTGGTTVIVWEGV